MVELKVDISELKKEGGDITTELANFLKEKTKTKVNTLTDAIAVEGESITRKYLRVLLKKFLHQTELKNYYRVISSTENSLKIKEKKLEEEE